MPTPGFTADHSLYRSRRPYRTASAVRGSSIAAVTPAGATCCDAVACKECPDGYGCLWFGSSSTCVPPPHAIERSQPRFLMATGHYPWPYHCTSGDGHAEIYCHSGCLATPDDVYCAGPGPWGVAEEQPTFLKA
jgi:hypothetical protein